MEIKPISVVLAQSPEWEDLPGLFLSIVKAQALRTKTPANTWQISTIAVWKTLRAPNIVTCVAVSPDGLTVASGSDNESAILWEVSTGRQRKTLSGHFGGVVSLSFSPDGQTLAVAADSSKEPNVAIWDVSTGRLRYVLFCHSDAVQGVTFSPDGALLASTSKDKTIRLLDTTTSARRAVIRSAYGSSIAFSPNGWLLATAGGVSYVELWDARTCSPRALLTGHKASATSIAFSPDSRILASGSIDRTVIIWDVSTGKARNVLHGHDGIVTGVAFAPHGLLASVSRDKTVKLWDAATSRELATLECHTTHVAGSIAFSPDGSFLASGSISDGIVILWKPNMRSG